MPVPPRSPLERFLDKIEFTESCWLWKAAMLQNGYGTFGVPTVDPHRHRTVLVHRYSYELFVGPIPRSLVIDHMCRVRHCVNPDHLRIVTRRINNLQNTVSHVALNPDKTHCPVGHLYDEENTYVSKRGYRQCRACHRAASHARYHGRKR